MKPLLVKISSCVVAPSGPNHGEPTSRLPRLSTKRSTSIGTCPGPNAHVKSTKPDLFPHGAIQWNPPPALHERHQRHLLREKQFRPGRPHQTITVVISDTAASAPPPVAADAMNAKGYKAEIPGPTLRSHPPRTHHLGWRSSCTPILCNRHRQAISILPTHRKEAAKVGFPEANLRHSPDPALSEKS